MPVGGIVLAVSLVLYNGVANRWRPFHSWAYVPLNLLAGTLVVLAGFTALGLDAEAMGLRFHRAWIGALLAAPALLVLAGLLAHPRARPHLADRRLEGLDARGALFMVAVRIPIGTALFEEMLFRGVLYGVFLVDGSPVRAAVLSSIAFGLWHLEPARLMVRTNKPDATRAMTVLIVAGSVAGTAVAGLLFAWLRHATGGIAAGVLLHGLVNASGAAAALVALRDRDAGAVPGVPV